MKHTILSCLILLGSVTIFAAEPIELSIPEVKLGPALQLFSQQTNLTVNYDDSLANFESRPISGTFLPEEALTLILSPSALVFEKVNETSFTVKAGEFNENMTVSAAVIDLAYRATVGATATKTDSLLNEIPQAIQIVPKGLLEDQMVRRLGGALSNVSSVQNRGSFLGAYEQFSTRGFVLSNRGNYFRDGRKYSNFVAPATEVLERVEVLKGPGSVLFGQAAPGGIINFITQQPPRNQQLSVDLAGGDQEHQSFGVNYGDQLGNSEKLYFRLVGSTESEDRFRDFVETDRRVLYGSLRYEINRALSVTFHFDDLKSDTVADTGLLAVGDRVIDQPLTTNYNEPWARYDAENTNIGYRLTALLSPSWQIRQSFNAQRLNRVRIDAFPILIDEDRGFVARRARARNQDFENDFADIQLIGDVQTGSVHHTLMFGAEYVTDLNDSKETANIIIPIALVNPVHDAEQPSFTPRPGNSSETVAAALYVQNQMEVGQKFDILLGLRYDDYDFEALRETVPFGPKASLFEAEDSAVTARVGAVWHATKNTSLYSGYSEGFVPNLDTRTLQPTFLDPEESRQLEIGAKLTSANNRFSLNLAAFDIEKNQILLFDPVSQTSRLIGKQVHQGFEADASGQLLPGWSIAASYSWLDAEIEEDLVNQGNTPENAPEHSGNIWTSYSVQNGSLQGLRLSLGLRSVASRFGDNAQSFTLPGYERVDLGIGYQFNLGRGELILNAKLENLFDEEYFLGALRRTQVTPGEPRLFIARAQYRF